MLQRLSEHLEKPPGAGQLTYTLESTGCYHIPVTLAFGGTPRLVNPVMAGATRRKTDVLDARLLAYHSITGMWPASFLVPMDVQKLRIMLMHRQRLIRERTRAYNLMNNIVLRFGHTFVAFQPLSTSGGWAIMEDMIDGKLPNMPGVSPIEIPRPVRVVLRHLYRVVTKTSPKVKTAGKRIISAVRCAEFGTRGGLLVSGRELLKVLKTHPGIGDLGAAIWLAEVVDTARFPNAKAIGAYAGLDPTLRVSAGKVTKHVRRAGNKRLNFMLTQAAKGLICRRKEALGRWGYSIAKSRRHGGYRKAAGTVARRMAIALWAMQRDVAPYNLERADFWRPKEVPDVPLAEMNLGRFAAVLENLGLKTSQEVAASFQVDLASRKGVGVKCLEAVGSWIKEHARKSHKASLSEEKSCDVPSEALELRRGRLSATVSAREPQS